MRLLNILRSIWIWTASCCLVILWTPLLYVVRLTDRDPRRLRTGRWFRRLGRVFAKVNPWRIRISGLDHLDADGVYVIASNHQSLADIPVLSHLRIDAKWLAKAELFRIPLVGWMLEMAKDIPVQRSDRTKSARALMQCAQYLRQRCSVIFFPEGSRSRDGQVAAFAEGPFKLAIREHVPVLPVVVEGSGSALPKNSWIFGPVQDIQLSILRPVSVAGWDLSSSGALRDAVRQTIADELSRLRLAKQAECPAAGTAGR